jgi:hypothetical protein
MEEADTPVVDNSTEDTASSSKGKGKRKASCKTRAEPGERHQNALMTSAQPSILFLS